MKGAISRIGLLVVATLGLAAGAAGQAQQGDAGPASQSRGVVTRVRSFTPRESSLKAVGIGDFELEKKVRQAMAAPAPEGWKATGIDRRYYLDIAEIVVRNAKDWVDPQGRVIDPILNKEVGQTTPRFASPGAVLLSFGRVPELKEVIFRTMDHCCQALPSGAAQGNSPDFWMRELVTAYLALQTVADAEHLKKWAAGLSAVEPEMIYAKVSPDGTRVPEQGNWAIYAAGGKAMRQAAGLKPDREMLWGDAFYEKYVGGQFGLFTANGMYRDPQDPFTYDVTTRLQAACGLAFGYSGNKVRSPVEELLRRGGLTMLLYISPEGFCPYGGRSAAFNFREAMVAALCELEARRYKESDPALAGAFKRQAHLSAISVRRWIDMKPLRHIKNGFAPASRHGIDSYGNYSVYSLLAGSFMALAAVCADDTIAETPCPAEKGGFAFELAPAFHKVFANCQGAYLEIDTAADLHYDATGLGCFAVKGVPLELGPGMPLAKPGQLRPGVVPFLVSPEFPQPAEPVAVGPAWLQDGRWVSLAGLSEGLTHTFKAIRETPQAVQFEIAYGWQKTTITEEYLLERGQVSIRAKVRQGDQPAGRVRLIVPLLVTDGLSKSTIEQTKDSVTVTYRGHSLEVQFPAAVTAQLLDQPHSNRLAAYRSLVLEAEGDQLSAVLKLK